jgi:diphthine synthase
MLSLIGLGLWDEEDITLKGLNRAKNADKVYIELYTSKWHGNIEKLEKIIDKKIEFLKREDLEEKSNEIIKEAKDKKVVLFVLGDPLIATTHVSLLSDAKKVGVKTEIIHNASIYSAICETGLHAYKFGSTVTVPFPEKTGNKFPTSISKEIKENESRDLHTLLLLDIIPEKNKYMTPNEGIKMLLKMNIFTKDTDVVVFARAGSDKSLIVYGKVEDLIEKNFGEPPFVIILPGKLHFTEKEYLEMFRVKE